MGISPLVFVVLAAGAFVVWYTTLPGVGGLGAVLTGTSPGAAPGFGGGPVARPFLTDAQINYYMTGFATHLTGTQAAAMGGQAGAPVAAATWGISIGVGALVGYLSVRNSNDTREDREVFAKRLGFTGANNDGLGIHVQQTLSLDDKSKGIYSYLTFIGRDDLREIAMGIIGRKDFEGNVQWMADTLTALWQAQFPFPR